MTPKQMALELVDKYLDLDNYNNLNLDLFCDECGMSNAAAKICALIAVDEILKANVVWYEGSIPNKYWQNVKKEIEKL